MRLILGLFLIPILASADMSPQAIGLDCFGWRLAPIGGGKMKLFDGSLPISSELSCEELRSSDVEEIRFSCKDERSRKVLDV